MKKTIVAIVLVLCGCSAPEIRLGSVSIEDGSWSAVLFRDVSVFDGEAMLRHRDVLVTDGRIEAVAATGSLAPRAAVLAIPGVGRTLLPGLVDSHAHLLSAGEKGVRPPDAEQIAEAFLFAGVTTILVTGGGPEVPDLLERSREGRALTPRMFAAGPGLTAPGGHPIPLLRAMNPWPMSWLMTRSVTVATDAEQAAARVREVAESWAPEFFKIIYDDLPPGTPHLSRRALVGAVREAVRAGMRPIAHTTTPEDTVTAAEVGVSLLVHVPQRGALQPEHIDRLLAAGIPIVSTVRLISASRELASAGPLPIERATIDRRILQPWLDDPSWDLASFSEEVDRNNAAIASVTKRNFQKLLAAGMPILVGTDSGVHGVFPGASMHREIRTLVELGMSPLEALRAATSAPASFLAADPDFGRVAAGMRADLLLVRGDPSIDIEALGEIEEVFLGGRRLARVSAEG